MNNSTRSILFLSLYSFLLLSITLLEWGFVFPGLFNNQSTLLLIIAVASATLWAALVLLLIKNIHRCTKDINL